LDIPFVFIDPVVDIFKDPLDKSTKNVSLREKQQFRKYTDILIDLFATSPRYECKERCKAPNAFYSGSPFLTIPSDGKLELKELETQSVEWQIWTSIDNSEDLEVFINQKKIQDIHQHDVNGMTFTMNKAEFFGKFLKVHASVKLNSAPSASMWTVSVKNDKNEVNQVLNVLLRRDAKLDEWSDWSACSISCLKEGSDDFGNKFRSAKCIEGKNGGLNCAELLGVDSQSKVETANCAGDIPNCPINHEYLNWTSWSQCPPCQPKSDPTVQRKRTRTCVDGRYGGSNCPVEIKSNNNQEVMLEPCLDLEFCDENCKLSKWEEWSSCSASCLNTRDWNNPSRMRTRIKLQDAIGSGECQHLSEKELCPDVDNCPINGEWTPWSLSVNCDKLCGDGKEVYTRECEGQAFGGLPCEGDSEKVQVCSLRNCFCDLTKWSDWSRCIATENGCGKGKMTRSRNKVNSDPDLKCDIKNGEKLEEDKDCFTQRCTNEFFKLRKITVKVLQAEYPNKSKDWKMVIYHRNGTEFCSTSKFSGLLRDSEKIITGNDEISLDAGSCGRKKIKYKRFWIYGDFTNGVEAK